VSYGVFSVDSVSALAAGIMVLAANPSLPEDPTGKVIAVIGAAAVIGVAVVVKLTRRRTRLP